MTVSKLDSGKWRAQVWDASKSKKVSVASILGPPSSFPTKAKAQRAVILASEKLGEHSSDITVAEWRDRWLSDPLFRRPKESTMIHYAERTKAFAERHGGLPLRAVSDEIVGEWLAGGQRANTVAVLRTMFADAGRAKAGRLIASNPFAGLGLSKGKGNADKQPPSEALLAELVAAAYLEHPAFGAWFKTAAFTGMRPGELDALRWDRVDFDRGRILVLEQFNAMTRTFTPPKNGLTREAVLTPGAREALLGLPRDSEFCFVSLRKRHFTASTRAYHWHVVRARCGWDESLYLATRHFAGWFMTNVLLMASEDVAMALGHEDGGEQVRRRYGHRDRELALDRVAAAYAGVGSVVPLKLVKGKEAS